MENQSNEGKEIVSRLLKSFSDLESAIEKAKINLGKTENLPQSVNDRLQSYSGILSRQRQLALVLEEHVDAGNLSEVARHITLINGLSAMIIEDARGLLSGLSGEELPSDSEEIPFC